MMLVQLQKITKNYGTLPLFENLNLKINQGDKIGLIGANGSGKSTVSKIIIGLESPDNGTVSCKKNIEIGYLSQIIKATEQPVRDYLLSSYSKLNDLQQQLTFLEQQMTERPEEIEKILANYGTRQEEFQLAGGYELESKLEMITNGLKINHLLNNNVSELSGGEQTLVELAKILVQENDLLLLDEPTNHLDTERICWLEGYLSHSKSACLIVSHDRSFLDNVVKKIVELEVGQLLEFQGNYSFYKKEKEVQLEKLRIDFVQQQKEIQKMKLAIRRFRQWGHEGDNEKFFKKAKQLEKRLEKIQKVPKPKEDKAKLEKKFKEAERSGKEVVLLNKVGKLFGHRTLFKGASMSLFWQNRTAIIGANGTGKSTLLKLIAGIENPTEGEIKIGSKVQIGYLPQIIHYTEPTRTILQEFSNASEEFEQENRRILAKYGFYQEDVMKQVRFLSGGEKIRLELAKLMQKQVNFLLLDEPTNHLDIETREEIEEILENFNGTLLVISHDRFFLEKMFDVFLVIKGQQITKEIGYYSDIIVRE